MHIGEGLDHHSLQAAVHIVFIPEQLLQILHPLEVGNSHASRIRKNVRNDHDPALVQRGVGVGSCRTIGCFRDNARLNVIYICHRDLVLKRRRNQNVALELQDGFTRNGIGVGKTRDRASLHFVRQQLGNVQSGAIDNSAARVADRNDGSAHLGEKFGRDAPRIAESLNGNRGAVQLNTHDLACRPNHEQTAACRCFVASKRPAEKQRFASYDAGRAAAVGHAVGVHDPRHGLRIRVDIGRGNVFIRSNDRRNFVCITAGEAFELVLGELVWIANNPPFRSTERKIDDGALPGHPGSQSFHLIKSDLRVIANAAFAGTSRAVVLHAESVEHVNRAVVHLDGQRKRERPPRAAQHFAHARIEAALFGGGIELAHRNAE